jgi:hypothetical protein
MKALDTPETEVECSEPINVQSPWFVSHHCVRKDSAAKQAIYGATETILWRKNETLAV